MLTVILFVLSLIFLGSGITFTLASKQADIPEMIIKVSFFGYAIFFILAMIVDRL